MDFRQIMLISLQLMAVLSKMKYVSSSDESIENLLYYQDCHKETTTSLPKLRLAAPAPRKSMDCPYPKMCCSLTCGGNDCGNNPPSSYMARMQNQMMEPMPMQDNLSPIGPMNGGNSMRQQMMQPPRNNNRKKKNKQPKRLQIQPPIGSRRSFGFTKEHIKRLINQDDDIRKILKDLVRVTMQKVDLVDMINSGKVPGVQPTEIGDNAHYSQTDDDDDDDDLE